MAYDWLETREERRQVFLNIGIDDNTQNVLARGGIFCYEELVQRIAEVRKFRHIGAVRLARIIAAVRGLGYEIPEGADRPWTQTERLIAEGKERLERRERDRRLRRWRP